MNQPPAPFMGTYFDKDKVLLLVKVMQWLAWILLIVYIAEWGYNTVSQVYQSIINNFTLDVAYYIMSLARPLQGGLTWAVLQAIAAGLLILMDIEDNTRRAARQK